MSPETSVATVSYNTAEYIENAITIKKMRPLLLEAQEEVPKAQQYAGRPSLRDLIKVKGTKESETPQFTRRIQSLDIP